MDVPEIRLLKAAIALAEELNFSRAAVRLRIDQSTLSKRIVELESGVGLRLFVRTHQLVELTEAGRRFVQEAKHALLHAERAIVNAAAASRGADEVLNLGKSAYADPYLLKALLSIQLPLFPGLKLKHWSNYSHELAHQVELGKLDMALVTAVPDTPKLNLLLVAESPLYIALLRDSPICKHSELRLQHLAEAEWILPAPHVNPHLHEMIQSASSESGIKVPEVHYVMTPEEAFVLIQARSGVAFMTHNCAEFVRAAGRKLLGRPPQQARLPMAC